MKKRTLVLLSCVVLAIIPSLWIGNVCYKAAVSKEQSLLQQNIEALTDDESQSGEFPGYINQTDERSIVERKFETTIDSTGITIQIEYKRTCIIWNTYCKHTGHGADICYERLNKMVTSCGDWGN